MSSKKKPAAMPPKQAKQGGVFVTTSPPPRYDAVFFDGVKWLDSLAGFEPEALADRREG